ncbi:MAG: hypothetical protein HY834_06580 [Devosia nanyangense]|uniref:Uncharacterized protein n=1 Tax=Devosia nanyangense TaxID=1228055 RepID=A0A933KZC7_9HYPH|nr:hypothetical protein [Devosia nanyangense]
MATYVEDFDDGPGGWMRVVDNFHGPAALPIEDGAVRCQGPWWVDYNHAPPGGGYLQLLMCLVTRGAAGESTREAAGPNRFTAGNFPTDFTNAKVTLRVRGELEAAGTKLSLLAQGSVDGICSGWVLTGQTVAVTPDYTETTVACVPDPGQWTSLGSRHDRTDTYGEKPLCTVLSNVDVNIHIIMFPVKPRPMGRIDGDPHILRAGRDYPIWPSSIAQGFVEIDRIQIDFAE